MENLNKGFLLCKAELHRYFMLRHHRELASGLRGSHHEGPVYIPRVCLPSNILFLITNDAATSDKHQRINSLLSVMSSSRCQKVKLPVLLGDFLPRCHVGEDIPHAVHPSLQITAPLPLRAGSAKQEGKQNGDKTSHPMSVFCQILNGGNLPGFPPKMSKGFRGCYSGSSEPAMNALIQQWPSFLT